jgi:hypothetical protein
MDAQNQVEITDKDGWRKAFPLQKPLIHIGSDSRNDIVLEASRGAGVAARHLQLIAVPGSRGYRAINLGDRDVSLGDSGSRFLLPRSAVDISDGEQLRLGEFSLVFRIGEVGPERSVGVTGHEAVSRSVVGEAAVAGPRREKSSASIGLRLSLPQVALEPGSPLEGMIAVRNLGNEPGVQFRLEVEGLEPDCYEVGPGPILFPNVEKGVPLRLYHPRRSSLLAGRYQIQIRATAPEAYPEESVVISQEIQVLPFYSHVLRLVAID